MEDFISENRQKTNADKAFEAIEKNLAERRKQRENAKKHTQHFADELFKALQEVAKECQAKGIKEIGTPRLIDHPAIAGKHALNLPIEDWNIVFVPLAGAARPNVRDEAQIAQVAFKRTCGRIAAFIGNDPNTNAFYDFIILPSGGWFAWGYGWPLQADTMEDTDFHTLALELLSRFTADIFTTWRVRGDTSLSAVMDKQKRAYDFGLPGDEL